MILYTKEQLIEKMREIFKQGWHRSVKRTIDRRNDGAVGNTLETLLGIDENNLPIPNVQEWELKGQRAHTTSLITLKHSEPSPRAARIVPKILLPLYGWRHDQAGIKYPETEMSFRSTTSAKSFTSRGFKIIVDRSQTKLRFIFDSSQVDVAKPQIMEWLRTVEERVGLGPLDPEPYWGFKDLNYAIGEKIRNCFYVIAESNVDQGREYFHFRELHILNGFSFERFLSCLEDGTVFVDFDARTGHNHGTKFRIQQGSWSKLYSQVQRAI